MKLSIQSEHSDSREAKALVFHSAFGHMNNHDDDTVIPVGDVPFCEDVLRRQGVDIPTPDYYPSWLYSFLYRRIQLIKYPGIANLPIRCFVKHADSYKTYATGVLEAGVYPLSGRYWISDVVEFTQEWRYYVSGGEVLTTGWYEGLDEEEPAPDIPIQWPRDFCGAVDFGRLSSGKMALVECHHPYACGHYSDSHELYAEWLCAGISYMKKNY